MKSMHAYHSWMPSLLRRPSSTAIRVRVRNKFIQKMVFMHKPTSLNPFRSFTNAINKTLLHTNLIFTTKNQLIFGDRSPISITGDPVFGLFSFICKEVPLIITFQSLTFKCMQYTLIIIFIHVYIHGIIWQIRNYITYIIITIDELPWITVMKINGWNDVWFAWKMRSFVVKKVKHQLFFRWEEMKARRELVLCVFWHGFLLDIVIKF